MYIVVGVNQQKEIYQTGFWMFCFNNLEEKKSICLFSWRSLNHTGEKLKLVCLGALGVFRKHLFEYVGEEDVGVYILEFFDAGSWIFWLICSSRILLPSCLLFFFAEDKLLNFWFVEQILKAVMSSFGSFPKHLATLGQQHLCSAGDLKEPLLLQIISLWNRNF